MKYLQSSFSVAHQAKTLNCCERCVYGRGEHAEWCPDHDALELVFSEPDANGVVTARLRR